MDYLSDVSDYEELPDVNISSMAIQPYMFEPTKPKTGKKKHLKLSESEDKSSDVDEDHGPQIQEESVNDSYDVSLWCSCQNCMTMPTRRESMCCRDTNIVDGRIEEAELDCIKEHEVFQVNCLNPYMFWRFHTMNNCKKMDHQTSSSMNTLPTDDSSDGFIKYFGKKNHRVIPSCDVKSIRDKFPSQQ